MYIYVYILDFKIADVMVANLGNVYFKPNDDMVINMVIFHF